jgi:thioredoxin-like negative regulator of GroEL
MRLSQSDKRHLEAAEGWLELGNHLEADAELDNITASLRAHPDVLEMRWKVYAKAKKWEMCLTIAETLADVVPRRPTSWLLLAATLKSMNELEDAYETLVEVVDELPDNAAIPFQLACYACDLGDLEEALRWVEETFKRDDSKQMKLDALKQPELEPLWKNIGDLQRRSK